MKIYNKFIINFIIIILFFSFSNVLAFSKDIKFDKIHEEMIIIAEMERIDLLRETISKKEVKNDNYYELFKKETYSAIYDFVKSKYGRNDPEYIHKVTTGFMNLYKRAPDSDKQNILYFVAVCSVESNFRMNSRSSAGAVGISQVMWSIWGNVIKKNYNISKTQVYNSIDDNIYVGYMIWRNYWRKYDYDIKKANRGYLGEHNNAYNNNINYNYVLLTHDLFKKIFNS